ncbi:MAG: alcohol dehydrogenase catalytic domain-containing protein [Lachnospiraceae bacterium]|jgi:ribitol-5-phosphate 2-dehydrogenase|nr:alcohol dehydrogenase catalytic domain-containing protein [Lachnospiraceae bacterium]
MLSAVYRLKAPRQFELVYKNIDFNNTSVIVKPTYLSICNADERYYQGLRPEEILKKKLPMALIHEGVGEVVYDPTGEFAVGDKVVMIPNTPTEKDDIIDENYLRTSKFRGSGFDGFMQEYVETTADRLVKLPQDINPYVAAFTEMVSVCYHAISRFEKFADKKRDVIGVWGDGNMGFIVSLLMKKMYPDSKVYVFGKNQVKLNDFTFADETYLLSDVSEDLYIDHAFECVGGDKSSSAINQIIDHITPEGSISLLGVSENNVPINTRMVLEKGLDLFGSSRSGREDFAGLIELYKEKPEILEYLENIVGVSFNVSSIKDANAAFEADSHKLMGKTIMIMDN